MNHRSRLTPLALLLLPCAALAASLDGTRQQAHAWLAQEVARAYPDALAKIEVGQFDPRLRLVACDSPRFFLPVGARLWSGGSLGTQCESPEKWSLYLNYQIQLSGPALITARALPARQPIGPAEVSLAKVRYEQDPGSYPREIPAHASTPRPLAAGQPLLVTDLLLPDVIQAGSQVQVRVSGAGFNVTQAGKALSAARPGGPVRVKMPNGQIVRGIATQTGEVEIRP